jgi:hypothetical protein
VEFQLLAVQLCLHGVQVQLAQRQNRGTPLALGAHGIDAQRAAVACGTHHAPGGRAAGGGNVDVEIHHRRGTGFCGRGACGDLAFERGGVQRAPQRGGIDLVQHGIALHAAGGAVVAALGRQVAGAQVDLGFFQPPGRALLLHIGFQLVDGQGAGPRGREWRCARWRAGPSRWRKGRPAPRR